MEFGEQLASGGEFRKAREAVCNAAWQTVENPEVPAWQRMDIALDMAQFAHDERAIDLLTGVFTGESELVKEQKLDDHDKVKFVDTLVEYGNPDEVQRAVAVANSIGGGEVSGASLRGKAFISIAEQTEGDLQKHCIDEAIEAASVLPNDANDPFRAFTDPERARVFLRAGTLTGDTSLYGKAFDVYKYTQPEPGRYTRREDDFGTLGWQIHKEIKLLDEDSQTELRDALVATTLHEYGQHKRPWDSHLQPLLHVLKPEERKQLLQNFTKRGKFMLDIAGYKAFVDTAREEGWLSSWKQRREERAVNKLQAEKENKGIRHLDESNTSWELFQFGYNDDATLQKALRNIEDRKATDMSAEDRADVRSRVAEGLSGGLFSPVQQVVAVKYLHEVHEASAADEAERFRSDLTMMSVEGDTEALAEAIQVMLETRPWERTQLNSDEHPQFGSHVDWKLGAYLRSVKAGEEKELLAIGVLIDK